MGEVGRFSLNGRERLRRCANPSADQKWSRYGCIACRSGRRLDPGQRSSIRQQAGCFTGRQFRCRRWPGLRSGRPSAGDLCQHGRCSTRSWSAQSTAHA